MKEYVIGDIHGHYDLLEKTLSKIYENPPGHVVFLGDYIDRGPKNREVLELLLVGPPDGWMWTTIRGNHEDLFLAAADDPRAMKMWIINGGKETLDQCFATKNPLTAVSVVDLFRDMPRSWVTPHRIYTHAGFLEHYPLYNQPEDVTQWYRYPKESDEPCYGRYVVHGHTPTLPRFQGKNRLNLDTGAVWSNVMTYAVFDSDVAGGPLEVCEVKL